MKIKKYLPAVIIALGIIAILVIWGRRQNSSTVTGNTDKIFFYGDTCPHCKNVEEFMATNGTRNKLAFQELEVYNNQANAQLLGQTAKKCGLDTDAGIGVPFFYDGNKCLMGDQEIINYFKQL
jgi:glutaredoxin